MEKTTKLEIVLIMRNADVVTFVKNENWIAYNWHIINSRYPEIIYS